MNMNVFRQTDRYSIYLPGGMEGWVDLLWC